MFMNRPILLEDASFRAIVALSLLGVLVKECAHLSNQHNAGAADGNNRSLQSMQFLAYMPFISCLNRAFSSSKGIELIQRD